MYDDTRWASAATALVLVALVLGILGTTFGMIRARRAERLASQEAETAKQVSDFLIGLFEVSDPTEAKGETITAREILDQGANRIRRELAGQPQVQARLMNTMGNVYSSLALYDDSVALLDDTLTIRRESLGESHSDVAETPERSGQRTTAPGEPRRGAVPLPTGVVDSRGGSRSRRAGSRRDLERSGAPPYRSGMSTNRRYRSSREPSPSARRRSAPMPWRSPTAWMPLGALLGKIGENEEARRLHERAVDIATERLGPRHPEVALKLSNLAIVVGDAGDLDGAREIEERVLAIREAAYGPDHPVVAISLNNLAHDIELLGDLAAGRHCSSVPCRSPRQPTDRITRIWRQS